VEGRRSKSGPPASQMKLLGCPTGSYHENVSGVESVVGILETLLLASHMCWGAQGCGIIEKAPLSAKPMAAGRNGTEWGVGKGRKPIVRNRRPPSPNRGVRQRIRRQMRWALGWGGVPGKYRENTILT